MFGAHYNKLKRFTPIKIKFIVVIDLDQLGNL